MQVRKINTITINTIFYETIIYTTKEDGLLFSIMIIQYKHELLYKYANVLSSGVSVILVCITSAVQYMRYIFRLVKYSVKGGLLFV